MCTSLNKKHRRLKNSDLHRNQPTGKQKEIAVKLIKMDCTARKSDDGQILLSQKLKHPSAMKNHLDEIYFKV
jgi:hypothetical protein